MSTSPVGRIGVISNPSSRQNRRRPLLADRLHGLLRPGDVFIETQHPDELKDAMVAFKTKGVEIVAINGGDGTGHAAISMMVTVWGDAPLPRIAFLRGGTMNTVPKSFGVHGRPHRLLRDLVSGKRDYQLVTRPLLHMTCEGHDSYGFIFGTGLLSAFLEEYYAMGEVSPWVAAKVLVKTVGSALVGGKLARRMVAPIRVEVTAEGERWLSREVLAVAASSTAEVGLSFKPFFRCGEREGHFHAVTVFGSLIGAARGLPAIRFGRPGPKRHFDDRVTKRLEIRTQVPTSFMVDGEVYDPVTEIVVASGPSVTVLVPQK